MAAHTENEPMRLTHCEFVELLAGASTVAMIRERRYLRDEREALRWDPRDDEPKRAHPVWKLADSDCRNKRGVAVERKKIAHNTYMVRREHGRIAVRFHATDVVTVARDGSVTVDFNGWTASPTTRGRVGDALRRYAPTYYVDSRDTVPKDERKYGRTALYLGYWDKNVERTRRHLVTECAWPDGSAAPYQYSHRLSPSAPQSVRDWYELPWAEKDTFRREDLDEYRRREREVYQHIEHARIVRRHYETETVRGDFIHVGNLEDGPVTVYPSARARRRAERHARRYAAWVARNRRAEHDYTTRQGLRRPPAVDLADEHPYVKVLLPDGGAPFVPSFKWPVGVKVVHEGSLVACSSGLHACRTTDLRHWYRVGEHVVRWAYPSGEIVDAGTKIVASEMRLGAHVPDEIVRLYMQYAYSDSLPTD